MTDQDTATEAETKTRVNVMDIAGGLILGNLMTAIILFIFYSGVVRYQEQQALYGSINSSFRDSCLNHPDFATKFATKEECAKALAE